MKNIINNIASSEAGFIFALFGIIAQGFHNYYFADVISSFDGIWRIVETLATSIFFSFGLLYIILKADGSDKYKSIINLVIGFEIFVNIFYYVKSIIVDNNFVVRTAEGVSLDWHAPSWYMLIVAIPFSIALPLFLKAYAGEIDVKQLPKVGKYKMTTSGKKYNIKLEEDDSR